MKIAVLGGSFSPIHIGHLILADSVCANLGYDRVLFVPVFSPPHKELSVPVSAEERFRMVEIAVRGDDRLRAERCEIDRGGVSYTWDTVCFLEKKYAAVLEGKLGLIIGEDLLSDFGKWNNAEKLARKTDLIVACRPAPKCTDSAFRNLPTGEYGKNSSELMTERNFPYPHKKVGNPIVDVSSSEIREKIARGGAWRYLVTEGVFEYIKNRNLYGTKSV